MLQADRKTTVTLRPHDTLKLEADGLQQQKLQRMLLQPATNRTLRLHFAQLHELNNIRLVKRHLV